MGEEVGAEEKWRARGRAEDRECSLPVMTPLWRRLRYSVGAEERERKRMEGKESSEREGSGWVSNGE